MKKKFFKTTIILEFIHEGDFESYDSSSLQSPGAIEHLGKLIGNQNTDPVITKCVTKSQRLNQAEVAEECGEDWVNSAKGD